MKEQFGERLCRIRKKCGLTQDELARGANVGRSSVQNWEADKYEPSLSSLLALSEALDVSVELLLGRVDKSVLEFVETDAIASKIAAGLSTMNAYERYALYHQYCFLTQKAQNCEKIMT